MNLLVKYIAAFNAEYLNERDRAQAIWNVVIWVIIVAGIAALLAIGAGR
jgi:hypothetical protein